MRSDDAVQTFKRHTDYNQHTAEKDGEYRSVANVTVSITMRWYVNVMDYVQIGC